MDQLLYHLVASAAWARATDPYVPASLASEGFVHCSTTTQVAGVAAGIFAGREDLLLVHIDPARLPVAVRWEDCYDHGQAFPHVYAPIDHAAIVAVTAYRPDPTGRFRSPAP